MDSDDLAMARERGLAPLAHAFPDEIAAAIALAQAQCDALSALPEPPEAP